MQSIGNTLRDARNRRGMSLEDVAKITRITRTSLEAIEDGSAQEHLPQVYLRGFVRAYANTVELYGNALVRELDSSVAPPQPDERVQSTPWSPSSPPALDGLIGLDTGYGLRSGHMLLLLTAIGLFLTAWFTVGINPSHHTVTVEAPPTLQEKVEIVSTYTDSNPLRP